MLSLLNYKMKGIVCDQTNNGTKHFFGQFHMEPPQRARHFCSHTWTLKASETIYNKMENKYSVMSMLIFATNLKAAS